MKHLVLFFLFSLLILPCYSQIKLHVGGGVNSSNIRFSNLTKDFTGLDRTTSATNVFLSVRPELALTEKIFVSLDIQFSQKGFNIKDQNDNDPSGYRFQYLDLIPQIQYNIIKKAAIYGGIGLAIRTKETYEISDIWEKTKSNLSNNSDPTYVLGLRFFPIKKLSIQAQLAGSLKNFSDIEYTDSFGNPIDIKSRLFNLQFGLAYQIF